jgi:hypothetical protein
MRALFLVLLAAAVVVVPSASATTRADLIVAVNVSLKPDSVTLSSQHVRRGYYVQFKVRNTTETRRIFRLAGRTIAIPARKFRYLAISFDVRGKYHYVSRPTASGNAVSGTFTVT